MAEDDAASDEDDGDGQDADMEPDETTTQEVRSSAGDVEIKDTPSTPVSVIFDNAAATESTAPSSQSQESDYEQSPEHRVAVDAEGSKDVAFSTEDTESG